MRTKADNFRGRTARVPIFPQVSILPDQALLWWLPSHDPREISCAREEAIADIDTKPDVELWDILHRATEGQHPVVGPAPGAAHRVKAVGANA
jgi:hypothetical protein